MSQLTLPAQLPHMRPMLDFALEFAAGKGMTRRQLARLRLVAEELCVNICQYAYGPSGGPMTLALGLSADGRYLLLRFADEGVPFNPLDVQDERLAMPLEERPAGGLGIYLVRTLACSARYRRAGEKNYLHLRMPLRGAEDV